MNERVKRGFVPVLALIAAAGVLWTNAVVAQEGERKNVWNGVYSTEAASRGEAMYAQYCASCHAESLVGTPSQGGPQLAGPKFMENWREDSVETLFWKIRNTMPRSGFRGSERVLTDREALDLVAFMFSKNAFPAGTEIPIANLGHVRIEGKDGPKPLPNNSQVQLIGCFQQETGDSWSLAQASAPSRLRGSAETLTPEMIKAAQARALGTLKFPLQNFIMLGNFVPDAHKGHKMLVQGVLIRSSGRERISLTKLESLATTCGQ